MNLQKLQKPIGEILVEEGIANNNSIEEALHQQNKCGSRIGTILLSQGKVSHSQISQGVAKQYLLEYVDITQVPCNEDLLQADDLEQYIRYKLLPWKIRQGSVILAVAEPNEDIIKWAKLRYKKFEFVIANEKDIDQTIRKTFRTIDEHLIKNELLYKFPDYSSKHIIKHKTVVIFLLLVMILFSVGLLYTPSMTMVLIIILGNCYYQIALLFKLSLFYFGLGKVNHKKLENYILDKDLPIYSILIPLYKEEAILLQLFSSIDALDYPKSKLDVKIILEAEDIRTIKAVESYEKPSYIDVIIVPHSLPKTKPKACNYAIRYIRGKYVTIYDAEDIPEPDQLRKAVNAFKEADKKTICFQARLNYYNRHVNYLTRFFAIEYSIWFNILLKGLYYFNMPVPLGGTSNHISVKHLKDLGYWDPYNVIEDADLGIRIAREGYKVALLDSTTWEESPIYMRSWLNQRSRWLKGYLQTYIIHMRSPINLIRDVGIKGFIGVNLFIGAPPLVYLVSPFMWSLSIVALMTDIFIIHVPIWLKLLMVSSILFNALLHIALAIYVVRKEKWHSMIVSTVLFPVYNLLNIVSSYKALWQLFMKPHFWEKTMHGLSLKQC